MTDRKPWYTIKNALPTDDGPAEILIYDEIDSWFGVSAADLVNELAKITASEITVRINSPGGSVFDGIAILNALRGHDAKITTVIDGIAASIASVIAMGGDEVVMNQNSTMMVHNAWNVVAGNADELQKAADTLRAHSANIASIYADKAGGSVDDWQAIMDAETWYTADEAVAAGLADRAIEPPKSATAAVAMMSARASFDLSRFKYAGRDAAPAPRNVNQPTDTPLPVEAEVTQGKDAVMATLTESLVEKLGLDAEADDDAILAKVIELADRPEVTVETVTVNPEPTLADAQQAVAKAGMVTIEAEALESLRAQAESGAQARAQQVRESDERAVDAAIARGAVAPARRDHHLAALAADREGHTAVLAALASGLVPLAEVGHGQGTEATNADDLLYASLFGQETN